MNTREQGDIGEYSAIEWFGHDGARVFVPVGHSPDVDLIADYGDRVLRVQVKTSATHVRNGRYAVQICTRGGNQSWNGVSKRFATNRCDVLFVHLADGRRYAIPADRVEGGTSVVVGGPKYADYEVSPGRPFEGVRRSGSLSCTTPAG